MLHWHARLALLFLTAGCTPSSGPGRGRADLAPGDLASSTTADLSRADQGRADLALGADSCTAEQACHSGICYAPGEFRGCGVCLVPQDVCTMDRDCQPDGGASICASGLSLCYCGGQLVCQPGCTKPSDCNEAQQCGTDHRCHGDPCGEDLNCPPNFVCGVGGVCARKTCTSSSVCSGYCVKGQCYAGPGQCGFPPP